MKRSARCVVFLTQRKIPFLERVEAPELAEEICCIDHRDHRIETGKFLQAAAVLVSKGKSLGYRQRLGNPSGFDKQVIETAFVREASHFVEQIFAQCATNAAIGHFNEFFIDAAQFRTAVTNQRGIDVHLAHVIHDDSHAFSFAIV